jgi:putative salt-induced outer membrane protein
MPLKMFYSLTGICAILFCLAPAPLAHANDLFEGWEGDVFAGYNQTNGNTEKASGTFSAKAVKNFEEAELSLKGSLFYSETDNKMDGQKWDGLAKYFFNFGEDDKWFNFYKVYVDHDYFADIDYRVTPSVGVGYHIAESEDWTWDVDAGLGYRITRHRVNEENDDEVAIAQAHTYMKKKIFTNAYIAEDLTVYPSLEGDSGLLLKSESTLSNPLTDQMDLELKYIVDFNSDPAAGKKKTDTQIIAGVKYKF